MPGKQALHKQAAGFIDTMDCLPVSRLPEGPEWTYEIKLDGYRLDVVRSAGRTTLYSRRRNVLNQNFHYIARALKDLPDETVIDGELVALSADGRPDFNLLQNFRSAESRIVYYAFDILIHKQRDLTDLPLSERRTILKNVIEPGEHVALSEVSDRSASEMVRFIKSYGPGGRSCEAFRQRLPARSANWPLEQVSDQPWAGVRGWRVHPKPSGRRFPRGGLLPWKGPHLRSPSEGWPCPGNATRGLRTD
jgi:ATP dependent DNA ligase domain